MDAKLDTLATSRKLEKSGMPGPQAEAVVEVVNDAMNDLVTKEFLKVELDRSFNEFERKLDRKLDERFGKFEGRFETIDTRFDKVDEKFDRVNERFERTDASINELKLGIAALGKSQAWGLVYMCGFIIATAALLFTALQFFGADAGAAAMIFP